MPIFKREKKDIEGTVHGINLPGSHSQAQEGK